jgi:hypothetical protein
MPNEASRTCGLHKKDANSWSNKLPERLETSLGTYRKGFEAAPLLDLERDAPAEYQTFALTIEEASKLHLAVESLIVPARCDSPKHQNAVRSGMGRSTAGSLAKRATPGVRQRLAEGRS